MDFDEGCDIKIKIEFIKPFIESSTAVEEQQPVWTRIVNEDEFKLTEGYAFQSEVKFEETRLLPTKNEPMIDLTRTLPCVMQTPQAPNFQSDASGTYSGTECKYKTKNKRTLEGHRDRHRKQRTFKCEKCSYEFCTKSELVRHEMFNTDSRPYKCAEKYLFLRPGPFYCDVCGYKSLVKSHLKRHIRVHTGAKPHICDICFVGFSERGNLTQHIRMHIRKSTAKPLPTYECYICGDGCRYQRENYLILHMRKYHFGGAMYSCDVCSEPSSSKNELRRHMTTVHTKTTTSTNSTTAAAATVNAKLSTCSICGYSTKYSNHLKIHLRKHSGEKPYKCNHCVAAFTSSSHLKRHEMSLHASLSLKCSECPKTFGEKTSLNHHIRYKHQGVKQPKKFKCRICSLRTVSKSNLRNHLLIHTGEKPFKCPKCSKAFTIKSNLERHMNTTACKRIYECDICSKTFHQPNYLKAHLRTHKGDNGLQFSKAPRTPRSSRKVQCSHCEFTSSFEHSLPDHMKRIHCISIDCSVKLKKYQP